jgi:ribonuclease HI
MDAPRHCLFTDGGSRGNPGPAAAGVVLTDANGRIVHSSGHFLGRATNNVAEYRALILGLQEARRRDISRLKICSDSELMVQQIKGAYRVKNEHLRPLHGQAMELLSEFEHATVEHIRREGNTLADEMANRAMTARADVGGRSQADFPAASAPGAAAPSVHFTAHCSADADEDCPGVISAGGDWPFEGTTPPGLCIYAAAGILNALLAAPEGTSVIPAACARRGCPARFQIRRSRQG